MKTFRWILWGFTIAVVLHFWTHPAIGGDPTKERVALLQERILQGNVWERMLALEEIVDMGYKSDALVDVLVRLLGKKDISLYLCEYQFKKAFWGMGQRGLAALERQLNEGSVRSIYFCDLVAELLVGADIPIEKKAALLDTLRMRSPHPDSTLNIELMKINIQKDIAAEQKDRARAIIRQLDGRDSLLAACKRLIPEKTIESIVNEILEQRMKERWSYDSAPVNRMLSYYFARLPRNLRKSTYNALHYRYDDAQENYRVDAIYLAMGLFNNGTRENEQIVISDLLKSLPNMIRTGNKMTVQVLVESLQDLSPSDFQTRLMDKLQSDSIDEVYAVATLLFFSGPRGKKHLPQLMDQLSRTKDAKRAELIFGLIGRFATRRDIDDLRRVRNTSLDRRFIEREVDRIVRRIDNIEMDWRFLNPLGIWESFR